MRGSGEKRACVAGVGDTGDEEVVVMLRFDRGARDSSRHTSRRHKGPVSQNVLSSTHETRTVA